MKNTQGANLRIAVLLPLIAIVALILWAAADIAREGSALKRLSEAEALVKAEAVAGKLNEARHLGLLVDGLADMVTDGDALLATGGPTLAEVVQNGLSLHIVDSGGRVIGGLGELPPPTDIAAILRETRQLGDTSGDWVGKPYICGDELCASYLHAVDYRDPRRPPDWVLVNLTLPPGIHRLPSSGADMLWRRRGGQVWLGPMERDDSLWFVLRAPLLDKHGLSLEVDRPAEGWPALWWQHNGSRFLLLAAAILACFGLAGLLAARLVRILRDHRRVQSDLMARENQIRAVFDLVPDGFIVHDLGRVIFANPGAVRMLRAESMTQLIGWDLFEIIDDETRDYARERTRRIQLEGIVPEPARMQAKRLDGEPMTIRVQGRPILFDNRQVVLSVFYDITQQDHIEAELEAARISAETGSKAKSEFLAHMSHELRTPLNSIIGFAELLDRQHLGKLGAPKYQEYVRDILDSGRHLLALINAVLDWSRVEAGKLALHEEEIDLLALGRICLRSVSEIAESRNVRLHDNLDVGPEPPLLYADARMTRQVILNLLSNALKFTSPGGEASIEIERGADDSLSLVVRDNGIGIDAGDLARVFEPFVQVDGSHRRSFEGTGLGLPLSRRLMEAHGGTLTLESAPDRGTVARMSFPAARVIEMPAHI